MPLTPGKNSARSLASPLTSSNFFPFLPKNALSGPRGEFEGALEGGAGVDRLAVRDDDALEGEVEEGA